MIAVLDGANETAMSYKIIVEGNATDDTMRKSIRMKARYLAQAYQLALDSMPYKTWLDCCQEAKCTQSTGQGIQWEMYAKTPASNF